jgi:hypothetical protein
MSSSAKGSSRGARFAWIGFLVSSCSPADAVPAETARSDAADVSVEAPDAGEPSETGDAEVPEETTADVRGEVDADDAADADTLPTWLSATGLYADLARGEELAPGVEPYTPAYELWADGATKRRWLWLPAGSRIDTSNMDVWLYPTGTRVWKEFRRDGVRVETRFITKLGPDRWAFMAYHWKDDQTDAAAVPKGLADASGTGHDIPSQVDCGICHKNVPDRLLGVTAIQLAHGGDGVTLDSLSQGGKLTDSPARAPSIPGSDIDRAALGYLHANCGLCHNPGSTVYPTTKLVLWLSTSLLDSVEQTTTYRTTVGVPFEGVRPAPDVPAIRITPGSPDQSAVYHRMSSRAPNVQMPPIATELADTSGIASVSSWIAGLSPIDGGSMQDGGYKP